MSEKSSEFRRSVRRWWNAHRRSFPWRETDDPYAILVSEIMLQQTQADRVAPKFEGFLARFPDVGTLSRAKNASVLKMWSGLGYNRRALNLKRAAEVIVQEHGGTVPTEESVLKALPGVGAYTAKAILAFAHNKTVAPVDTNIRRIYIRHFGDEAERDVQAFADTMVPRGQGRNWSSMLMDFGALTCRAKNPACDELGLAHMSEPKALPRQKPFRDSDRFWRGRVVEVLRARTSLPQAKIQKEVETMSGEKLTAKRAQRIIESLVRDGLITQENNRVRLS